MPLRRISAVTAFQTYKSNTFAEWPRRDDPENRFAHFADPAFHPSFTLEPGQRIFTIGSCFARNIEMTLEKLGFDVPTLAAIREKTEDWGGNPYAALNNYIPQAIAPQIRWAFGMEAFDIEKHAVEVQRNRYADLQVPPGFRPLPADRLIERRERINAVYRKLARSHVVLITLGLIEAWFDRRGGSYLNATPPKAAVRAERDRFELHVLDYQDVLGALRELVDLLDRICPKDYRMILTVSPVPLAATFTPADVAVANCYSKSVLRAASEAIVAERSHIDYFSSYESVTLTDRSIAFVDDQAHVEARLVRFNVERMIARYVPGQRVETAAAVIAQAQEDMRSGRLPLALKKLQGAWGKFTDPALTVALADAYLRAGDGAAAERLLLKHLESHGEDIRAHGLLARRYNQIGRHAEAAAHAESAAALGRPTLDTSLSRVAAYFHLGRYEEALGLVEKLKAVAERQPLVLFWRARCNERLGRPAIAEELYRECNNYTENADFKLAFAEFLAAQGRWDEVGAWVGPVLAARPFDSAALRLRAELARRRLTRQLTRPTAHLRISAQAHAIWRSSLARFRAAAGAAFSRRL